MRPLKTILALALAEYELVCDRADAAGVRAVGGPFMCHVVMQLATRRDITRAEADLLLTTIEEWIDHHVTLYAYLHKGGLPCDRHARRAFYRAKLEQMREEDHATP